MNCVFSLQGTNIWHNHHSGLANTPFTLTYFFRLLEKQEGKCVFFFPPAVVEHKTVGVKPVWTSCLNTALDFTLLCWCLTKAVEGQVPTHFKVMLTKMDTHTHTHPCTSVCCEDFHRYNVLRIRIYLALCREEQTNTHKRKTCFSTCTWQHNDVKNNIIIVRQAGNCHMCVYVWNVL